MSAAGRDHGGGGGGVGVGDAHVRISLFGLLYCYDLSKNFNWGPHMQQFSKKTIK